MVGVMHVSLCNSLETGFLPVIKQYLTIDLTDSENEETKESEPTTPTVSYDLDESGKWDFANIRYSVQPVVSEDATTSSNLKKSTLTAKNAAITLNYLLIQQLTSFFNSVILLFFQSLYFKGTYVHHEEKMSGKELQLKLIEVLTKTWSQLLPNEMIVELQNPKIYFPLILHYEDILNQGTELSSLFLSCESLTYSNQNTFKQSEERKAVLTDLQSQEIISSEWVPLSYYSYNIVGTQARLGVAVGPLQEENVTVSFPALYFNNLCSILACQQLCNLKY